MRAASSCARAARRRSRARRPTRSRRSRARRRFDSVPARRPRIAAGVDQRAQIAARHAQRGREPTTNATSKTHAAANRNTLYRSQRARTAASPRGRSPSAVGSRPTQDRDRGLRPRAQDEALGHELAKHAPPAGTERFAQRELARPNHAAREQQVRHVDAGDQRRTAVAPDTISSVDRKSPTTSSSNGRATNSSGRPSGHGTPSRPAKTSSSA